MSRSRSISRGRSHSRGRSPSPREPRVVVISNLTRNIVQPHLQAVFSVYGRINKIDIPLYAKSQQNRGKAALEFADSSAAAKAQSHMDGGQLDGNIVTVILSSDPIRSPSPRSRSPRLPPRRRSRSPPRFRRGGGRGGAGGPGRFGGGYQSRPVPRDSYRGRRDSRSRSPPRRGPPGRLPLRRRSPSYGRYSSRSRSRSPYSRSRSRSRSYSRSRSRSRSRSYSSYSSRSRSYTPRRRSKSRDDIRDSRSRSRSRSPMRD